MNSVYVEQRGGGIAVGYTYFPDTNEWNSKEKVGESVYVNYTMEETVPEFVKKAVKIMLEGE